jgi:hypothetical protein
MIVSRREYLATLDKNRTKAEAHRALLRGSDALLQVLVGLVTHLRHVSSNKSLYGSECKRI